MIIDSPIISGSLASTGSLTQIGSVVITGSLSVSGPIKGNITGSADSSSFATSASYSQNADLLDGLNSTAFVYTSSYNQDSSSFSLRVTNTELTGSSLVTASGSFSTRVTTLENSSASFAQQSGSNSVRLTNLESTASVLTTASASFAVVSSSFALTSGSDSTRITNLESTASVLTTASGSFAVVSSSFSTTSGSLSTRVTTLESASSSFAQQSGSNSVRLTNLESTASVLTTASASFAVVSSSFATTSGSMSLRITNIEGNYATTGSNVFLGAQTVCANITSTGTIIAQTINVQQVTSSIVYSSGSNIFGNQLTDTQQFTGSVLMTGSLHVIGNTCVTSICSPSFIGGTVSGTTIYGSTVVCGATVSIGGADQGYNLDVKRTSTGDSTFDTVANFYKASTHNTGLLIRLKNTIVDLAANNITGGGGPTAGISFSVSPAGGSPTTAFTIASTGIACFACQVCAPMVLASGCIGIGNTSPAYRLDVYRGSSGVVLNLQGVDAYDAETGILFSSSRAKISGFLNPSGGTPGTSLRFYTMPDGGSVTERLRIDSGGIACFAGTVCMANTIFSTAGTATLVNTNITSTACFGSTSRSGFTGLTDNCNGVYFGMGADGTGISAGIGFFREPTGWNSALAFYTNCITDGVTVPRIQEKMRITSGGNVGIGTSSPTYRFETLGTSVITAAFGRSDFGASNAMLIAMNGYRDVYKQAIGVVRTGDYDVGDMIFALNASANSTVVSASDEKLRITSTGIACFACQVCAPMVLASGCVGIGNTSPIGKLDVTLLNTRRFIVTYDDSIITIKGASDTGAGENLRVIGDNLIFNTNSVGSGTERLRITSTGIACFACQVCSAGAVLTGDLTLSSGGDRIFSINDTGGNLFQIQAASNVLYYSARSTGGSLAFRTNGSNDTKFSIASTGIACFACQVCMPATAVISGGGNTLILKKGTGSPAIALAGTSDEAAFLIESISGGGMKWYTSPAGCTLSNAAWNAKFNMDVNGISTFSCQVCAPVGVFSGCVGIGTGSPQDKLYIIGVDNGITICSLTQNRPVLSLVNGSATMLKLSANGVYGAIASCTGDLMYFYGGNIGIGQTNPSFALEVYSSSAVAITSNNTFSTNFNLIFNRDNTGSTRNCFNFLADQNSAYIRTLDNYPINFVTNGENRILLTNTGIACFRCQVCTPAGVKFGNGSSVINYYCSADWAPQFYAGGSTSFGLSSQTGTGKFTRIGNVVFLHGQISWTGSGNSSCTLLSIQNLPFQAVCSARGGIASGLISGISQIASGGLNLVLELGTCIIYLVTNCGAGAGHIHLNGAAVTSGGNGLFSFGGSYITNDAS